MNVWHIAGMFAISIPFAVLAIASIYWLKRSEMPILAKIALMPLIYPGMVLIAWGLIWLFGLRFGP